MRNAAARVGLGAAAAATLWSSAAAASGHGLDALDAFFGFVLLVVAFVPWTISWWLFIGWEDSVRVFIWGTVTSALATVLVAVGGLAPGPLYVGVALLPAAGHLVRRLRGELNRNRPGGPGQTGAA